MRIYPYFPEWYWGIAGIIAYFGNETKEALGHFDKVIQPSAVGLFTAVSAAQEMNEPERALELIGRLKEVVLDANTDLFRNARQINSYKDPSMKGRLLDAANAAGLEWRVRN